MTADLLALLESDPAAGILAVAELRERRAKAATRGHWLSDGTNVYIEERSSRLIAVTGTVTRGTDLADAEHIAAEASPAHALAAVRRWRGVVERHGKPRHRCVGSKTYGYWEISGEIRHLISEPCPDLIETADEAKAYLGGAS